MQPKPLKEKDYWATPHAVFNGIERITELRFELDACANAQNTKCGQFITEQQNTLATAWGRNRAVFMNPPYSNPLPFVARAIRARNEEDCNVAVLLNADTSTRWFDLIAEHAQEIFFITQGRVAFLDYRTGKAIRGNNRPQLIACFYNDSHKPWLDEQVTHYIPLKELINA